MRARFSKSGKKKIYSKYDEKINLSGGFLTVILPEYFLRNSVTICY